jgi:hypothetical protein
MPNVIIDVSAQDPTFKVINPPDYPNDDVPEFWSDLFVDATWSISNRPATELSPDTVRIERALREVRDLYAASQDRPLPVTLYFPARFDTSGNPDPYQISLPIFLSNSEIPYSFIDLKPHEDLKDFRPEYEKDKRLYSGLRIVGDTGPNGQITTTIKWITGHSLRKHQSPNPSANWDKKSKHWILATNPRDRFDNRYDMLSFYGCTDIEVASIWFDGTRYDLTADDDLPLNYELDGKTTDKSKQPTIKSSAPVNAATDPVRPGWYNLETAGGLRFMQSADVVIRDCIVTDTWGGGIKFNLGCGRVLVEGCTMARIRHSAISFTYGREVQVRGCRAFSCGTGGYHFEPNASEWVRAAVVEDSTYDNDDSTLSDSDDISHLRLPPEKVPVDPQRTDQGLLRERTWYLPVPFRPTNHVRGDARSGVLASKAGAVVTFRNINVVQSGETTLINAYGDHTTIEDCTFIQSDLTTDAPIYFHNRVDQHSTVLQNNRFERIAPSLDACQPSMPTEPTAVASAILTSLGLAKVGGLPPDKPRYLMYSFGRANLTLKNNTFLNMPGVMYLRCNRLKAVGNVVESVNVNQSPNKTPGERWFVLIAGRQGEPRCESIELIDNVLSLAGGSGDDGFLQLDARQVSALNLFVVGGSGAAKITGDGVSIGRLISTAVQFGTLTPWDGISGANSQIIFDSEVPGSGPPAGGATSPLTPLPLSPLVRLAGRMLIP